MSTMPTHPRRTRLGLIEANPHYQRARLPGPGIRGARASASLKRVMRGWERGAAHLHPRRTRLGLIEAVPRTSGLG